MVDGVWNGQLVGTPVDSAASSGNSLYVEAPCAEYDVKIGNVVCVTSLSEVAWPYFLLAAMARTLPECGSTIGITAVIGEVAGIDAANRFCTDVCTFGSSVVVML